MAQRFYGGEDSEEKEKHDEMMRKQRDSEASWARSYQLPSLPYDGVSY